MMEIIYSLLVNNTFVFCDRLLLFLISTIGLTNILVHGKIMDVIGLRGWLRKHLSKDCFEMLECYECTGFWAGLLCGLLLITYNPLLLLPCGWAGSVASQYSSDLIFMIRSLTKFEVNDED